MRGSQVNETTTAAGHAGAPLLEVRNLRTCFDVEGETAWAQCTDELAYDPDGDRRRQAPARELDLDLALGVSREQNGSAVTLRPRFERTYLNSFTNLEFTRPCRSTGELERTIFERLQAS